MRKNMGWLLILGVFCYLPLANAYSPEGRWTTIDEKTGEKRADVQFTLVDNELSGTIVRRYVKPGDMSVCVACPGQFKDKSIQGLRFIWGLKDEGNGTWGGGRLLDPQTGKIYHLKVTLKDDALHVRGYIGVPLIGRTQVWVHTKA